MFKRGLNYIPVLSPWSARWDRMRDEWWWILLCGVAERGPDDQHYHDSCLYTFPMSSSTTTTPHLVLTEDEHVLILID
jgi:hypothetical protein